MAEIDPMDLVDRLEYADDRSEANTKFQEAMASVGISDGFISLDIPIGLDDPWLDGTIQYDVFGRRAGPYLKDLRTALQPLVRSGIDDLMVAHLRQHVSPLAYKAESQYTEPILSKAASVTKDHRLSGVFLMPCHNANEKYSVYGLYTLNQSPEIYSFIYANLELLHLSVLYFESACQLKFSSKAGADLPSLAPRERECLLWVAAGLSSKRIAYKLGISLHTVNEFIGNAMRKLDATTRAEAAAKAVAAKIINP